MTSSPLDTVVRHIRRMALNTNCRECSDAQLLRHFVSQGDEAAFTALLRRHERLVWRVCWNALGHVQDAEDAFQATFVVLAQSAAKIAKQEMLGSWLHGVALRIALTVQRGNVARSLVFSANSSEVPKWQPPVFPVVQSNQRCTVKSEARRGPSAQTRTGGGEHAPEKTEFRTVLARGLPGA